METVEDKKKADGGHRYILGGEEVGGGDSKRWKNQLFSAHSVCERWRDGYPVRPDFPVET